MPVDVKIHDSWKSRLKPEFDKPYFEELIAFVRSEYATQTVYPPGKEIFSAFDACPFDEVKVVIIGQDPYHGPGSGERALFLRARWRENAPFTGQYFQGDQARPGYADTDVR